MKRATMVPKRGRNEASDYNYASEADVLSVIRPLLLEEGLIVVPSLETWQVDRETGNAFVVLRAKIINIDNPAEVHEVSMVGSGKDWTKTGMGDKAVYKATTGANKYILLKSCMLPTGDDPEVARQEEFQDDSIHKLIEGAKAAPPMIPAPMFPPQMAPATAGSIREQPGNYIAGGNMGQGSVSSNPFALPRPNGPVAVSTNIDPQALTPEELQIARMIQHSRMQQAEQMEPPPVPVTPPEVEWSRTMRRAAEDSTTSDAVIKLWNDNKEAFRKLQMQNLRAYEELHATFRDKRDSLRSEGK